MLSLYLHSRTILNTICKVSLYLFIRRHVTNHTIHKKICEYDLKVEIAKKNNTNKHRGTAYTL